MTQAPRVTAYPPGMERMWAPWRMEYIGPERPTDEGCFLCRAGEEGGHDGLLVDSADLTLTVMNRFPYTSGHLMVVPRRHVRDITVLSAPESLAVMSGAQRAIAALDVAMSPQGYNMGINQGHSAGGSVADHLHLHVVPRWAGDTNFMPVLADIKILPQLLQDTAERIRSAFAGLE